MYGPTGCCRRKRKPASRPLRSACQSTTSGRLIFRRSSRARLSVASGGRMPPPPCLAWFPSPLGGGGTTLPVPTVCGLAAGKPAADDVHRVHAGLRVLGSPLPQGSGVPIDQCWLSLPSSCSSCPLSGRADNAAREPSSRVIWTVRVYIEIHDLHAT